MQVRGVAGVTDANYATYIEHRRLSISSRLDAEPSVQVEEKNPAAVTLPLLLRLLLLLLRRGRRWS